MTRVFTHESLVLISHVRNLLDQAGIRTLVKNERLAGALGEIPFLETWPELWVVADADADRARTVIADALTETPVGPEWTCSRCGEVNEGQFAICWQCQTVAPS